MRRQTIEERVFGLIRANPGGMTISEIVDVLKVSKDSAKKALQRMYAKGAVAHTGLRRACHWRSLTAVIPILPRKERIEKAWEPKKPHGPPKPQTMLEKCWGWYPRRLSGTSVDALTD